MERLEGRSHRARALEWGVILVFILILIWVVVSRFQGLEERAVTTVARYEYQLLQTRIRIYRLRNGQWPADLRDALGGDPADAMMTGPNARRDRLVDEQGRLINPFGRPYRYDSDTGQLEMPDKLAGEKARD